MEATNEVTCYLSLGSNLGDREAYLRAALQRLVALPEVTVLGVSSLYDTAPVGETGQPRFLNLVAGLRVKLSARGLLRSCQRIENELGRTRERHWGPRTVDLDVLLYDDLVSDEPDLRLPHPRMLERQFVLAPLAEIAPELRLTNGRTAAEAADFNDPGIRCLGPLAGWTAQS